MEPIPSFGRVHSDLFDRLVWTRHNRPHEQLIYWAFHELASTPGLWPLDDVYLELLLSTAGFNLAEAGDVGAASWVLSMLVAGDPTYGGLYCGHGDEPSALCALRENLGEVDEQYCGVMDLQREGSFDDIYDLHVLRELEFQLEALDEHLQGSQ